MVNNVVTALCILLYTSSYLGNVNQYKTDSFRVLFLYQFYTHIFGREFSLFIDSQLTTHKSDDGSEEMKNCVLQDPMFTTVNEFPVGAQVCNISILYITSR